ncbi:MAG: hypothetical protein ACE5HS_21050 [bacterium]
MNKPMLELLYRSLDGHLSKEEQTMLEQALSASPELRKEKDQILAMRQTLSEGAARTFKPFFSARVMQKVRSEAKPAEEFVHSLLWAFRRIALGGAVAIALLLAINLFVEKNQNLDALLGVPQPTLEDTWQLENVIPEENL